MICLLQSNFFIFNKNSPASIIGYGDSQLFTKDFIKQVVWLRPEEFFVDEHDVYFTVEPDDIFQGLLGDCYFQSALAAIAENPKRIKKIFLSKKKQDAGIYCVNFYINGTKEAIYVDDLFPCSKDTKKPIFNRSDQEELWVMILEKAFAKICGGYANIEEGYTSEAQSDLTGAPVEIYINGDEEMTSDERFSILWYSDYKNYIMCAGSKNLGASAGVLEDPKTGKFVI